jgi:CRISPR-associated protein (TIGR02584 family)
MTASAITKNLLLSVTGMSPAVVTETLYGIAERIKAGDKNAHWPDEIRIITTSKGKGEMVSRLVSGDWLRQVCEAVGQPVIAMADEHILVVPGADGSAVEDARSEEDHEALANFITKTVRDFTSENSLRIHASIAGGRKTMTFYLGYAMSLFGRHFDRMSHVLISEGFESARGFYFPGQEPHRLETGPTVLDTRDAKVTLADIPFIRMRHNLPLILKEKSTAGSDLDYRKLVNLINLGDRPDDIRLTLCLRDRKVKIADMDSEVAVITLSSPVFMAFYAVFAAEAADEDGVVFTSKPLKESEHRLLGYFATQLADIVGLDSTGMTSADILQAVQDVEKVTDEFPNFNRSIQSIISKGIKDRKMSELVSAVTEQMKPAVPANLLRYVLPVPEFNKKKEWVAELDEKGGHRYYGIHLKPGQITIVE